MGVLNKARERLLATASHGVCLTSSSVHHLLTCHHLHLLLIGSHVIEDLLGWLIRLNLDHCVDPLIVEVCHLRVNLDIRWNVYRQVSWILHYLNRPLERYRFLKLLRYHLLMRILERESLLEVVCLLLNSLWVRAYIALQFNQLSFQLMNGLLLN